jgi:uncharacterized protein (DUF302 family)
MTKSTIEGLTTVLSNFGPKDMMDRFEAEIRAQGMRVFARIDHAAGAAEVGLALGPRFAVEGPRLAGCVWQNMAFP